MVKLPLSFLCGGVFLCDSWCGSGRCADLFLPYEVRLAGVTSGGRKKEENRTGDGNTDGTVPDVSTAVIRKEERA